MTNDDRKLVLVVDADPGFVEGARALVTAHRSLTARDLSEAAEIVLGGRVDVVVLGPAFASEHSIAEASALSEADPSARVVLVADIVTNRLLKAALRAGFADVVDAPLTAAALTGFLPEVPGEVDVVAATEIEFVVEPAVASADVEMAEQYLAPPVVPPHHPSQYEPEADPEPVETIGSGNGWAEPAERTPVPENPVVPTAPPEPMTRVDVETPVSPPTPWTEPAPVESPEPAVWPDAPSPTEPPMPEPPPEQVFSSPFDSEPREEWAEPVPDRPGPVPVPTIPHMPDVPPQTPPDMPTIAPPSKETSDVSFAERTGTDDAPERRPSGAPGRVIAVMAGKGGSGKSVVATNLAIAFGLRHDPERVAIVDADLQFGDVALMLQIDPIRTLDDLVSGLDSLTDARLEAALLRHESGIRVLPAPLQPVRDDSITAKSVVEVVDRLRSLFDTIVVDTGPVFGDALITTLEHADAVVAVVDMDLPSVKNAKVALDALRANGFPMERITLVVNRVNSKARLDLVELERSLGLRVGGSVPSDRLVPQSVNEGIPLLALSPRSKVARSFMALAERLDPTADRSRLNGGGR